MKEYSELINKYADVIVIWTKHDIPIMLDKKPNVMFRELIPKLYSGLGAILN